MTRRQLSDVAIRRASRRAEGATFGQIAAEEGIAISGARESVYRVVRQAARHRAAPGSDLPTGLQWRERQDGSWYVSLGGVSPEAARWALALLKANADPSCPTCGRRF